MFIEQLDSNKIKVIVDVTEQKEYGVTYESMTYSDTNTRKLCESIMERAKTEIGFNTGGAKLLVEAKRQSDGSVTLYMSKLSEESEHDELFGQTVMFGTFDNLCDCKEAFAGYESMLTVFSAYLMNGKFYLYFEMLCQRKQASCLLRNLLEFGEKTRLTPQILDEHGKKLDFFNYNTIFG